MAVPYTFGTATTSIPLSQLDTNFATAITLGNTAVYLGNTTTSIGNLALANVSISSVASAFPNSYLANSTATLGNATITLGGTTTSVGNLTLTNVTISSVSAALTPAQGGTGVTTTPSNGQIPIGNGTTYVASTITAGSGITVTNGSGTITIASSGGGSTSIGLVRAIAINCILP
jgi:hypothetical protein